jgi:glycosyltransferase involved in cell wall biosynthesis
MLAGWQRHSQHVIEILGLPARHWKWRMRHAAYTLAEEARRWLAGSDQVPDVIFASSMLDLPQWRGHVGGPLAQRPAVVYFHENQLTHPLPSGQPIDLHYGYTNILTALAADAVWFNSAYHRDSFFPAADEALRRFPDYRHRDALQRVAPRAEVLYPGIDFPRTRRAAELSSPVSSPQPLHLGWIARWEFDKRPERLLEVLTALRARALPIQLTVLSKPTRASQPLWDRLQREFAAELAFAGYAPTRQDYAKRIGMLEGVLSTAAHEFFGIAIAEAAAAGVIPVVPNELAYPELYGGERPVALFHDGSVATIVNQLDQLAQLRRDPHQLGVFQRALRDRVAPLAWPQQAARFDAGLSRLIAETSSD